MLTFAKTDFPSTEAYVRAQWAPVLLRPILGSPEQVVIGVVAISDKSFHLERANALTRLECLLSEDAASAVLAATTGLDALAADLSARSKAALLDYRPIFSGICIGNLQDTEGATVTSIARSWLYALSSLVERDAGLGAAKAVLKAAAAESQDRRAFDRLPILIHDYIKSKRPEAEKFFSQAIREQRAPTGNASAVRIDYSGSKVVANFGALLVNKHKASVLQIKKSLWDLKVDRDSEKGGFAKRNHEMIVQHPPLNDPQFTAKQLDTMGEALIQLEKQADQEELRFRPMHSVPQIGDHILQLEAA